MDSVGEGEGRKIWENGIETCKISCMKRVASLGSMHDTGCLGMAVALERRDNGDGTVTVLAAFEPKGMTITVR